MAVRRKVEVSTVASRSANSSAGGPAGGVAETASFLFSKGAAITVAAALAAAVRPPRSDIRFVPVFKGATWLAGAFTAFSMLA